MPNLGGGELLIVAAVVMLLFGAKKLPEFARSLGKAKGEFKRGLGEDEPAASGTASATETEPKK